MKSNHYWRSVAALKLQVRDALPHQDLKRLHVKRPAVHLAYTARQFGIIAVSSYALWQITNPWLWLPIAILQGFTFFNTTTLLHEREALASN